MNVCSAVDTLADHTPTQHTQACGHCDALKPLLKRVEDQQPFPTDLKKLLDATKQGSGAGLTLALVGRAWLQLWRDQHAADKPSAQPLGPPAGSLLLLGCPHAQTSTATAAAAATAGAGGVGMGRGERGRGEREREGEREGEGEEAGKMNLPLYLHDLLERGVVSAAGLKEVGGWCLTGEWACLNPSDSASHLTDNSLHSYVMCGRWWR